MTLRRYWFEFEESIDDAPPLGTLKGIGVTAEDREGAMAIIAASVFAGREVPRIKRVIEDVDVSTLDAGHVLPNIGDVLVRGVWYPLGYSVRQGRLTH